MNIAKFAIEYKLKTRQDSCDETIIPGRQTLKSIEGELTVRNRIEDRNHIYENGDGQFGICLMFLTRQKWTYAKQGLLRAGLTLRHDGDTEGTLLFSGNDTAQSKAAIKAVGAKTKKQVSPETLARLTTNGFKKGHQKAV